MDESFDDEYDEYCFGEIPARAFASRSRLTARVGKVSLRKVETTASTRSVTLRRWPRAPTHETASAA